MTEKEEAAAASIRRARDTLPMPIDRLIARAIWADISDRRGWKDILRQTGMAVIDDQVLPVWEEIVRQLLHERDQRRYRREDIMATPSHAEKEGR